MFSIKWFCFFLLINTFIRALTLDNFYLNIGNSGTKFSESCDRFTEVSAQPEQQVNFIRPKNSIRQKRDIFCMQISHRMKSLNHLTIFLSNVDYKNFSIRFF